MPTSTHLDDLKINVLTESQFDAAVQGGVIGAGEISMITDLDEAIQADTLPTAAASELGKIYQFTGTTGTYTHGYFYECVSDGQPTPTYSWSQVNVQPAPSGLPSQTGNSGKFLTTDGTDASWATVSAGQTIQYDTMPTASADYVGKIAQYTGVTDANYTQGCFYRGASYQYGGETRYTWTYTMPVKNLTADSYVLLGYGADKYSGSYTSNISIGVTAKSTEYGIAIGRQATASGSSSIHIGSAYTGESGYGATGNFSIAIGRNSGASNNNSISLGTTARTTAAYAIAIGDTAKATATRAIQLGAFGTNADANTLKVANTNGNFELLSANGTIPTDRFTTTPVADGTYVPTLTISSGVATRTWGAAASAPVVPATAPTLAVADWSSNTQTITVSGVTSSNVVLVGPAPSSAQDYADAGIICTAQGTDSLTFTCTTVPSNAITLSVVIFG